MLARDRQAQLQKPYDDLKRTLAGQELIPVIRESVRLFDDTQYQTLLGQMVTWAQPETPNSGNLIVEPPVEYVSQRSLQVPFDNPWLENEQDVQAYAAALQQALLDAVHAGKRVRLL